MFFALQISQPPSNILKVKKSKNRDENCSSNKHTMVNLDNIHLSEAEMDFDNRTIRKRSPSNKAFLRNLSPSRLFNLCSSQQSTTNTFVQSCEGNSQLLKLAEKNFTLKKQIDSQNELINRQKVLIEILVNEINKANIEKNENLTKKINLS